MAEDNKRQEDSLWPTVRLGLFLGIGVLIIWFAWQFNQQKTAEFQVKSKECQEGCTAKGFSGSEFKGTALTGAQCKCF